MRTFARACAYVSNCMLVSACTYGFVAGVYRWPIERQRETFGASDVWMALVLGIPSLIGAIGLLTEQAKRKESISHAD